MGSLQTPIGESLVVDESNPALVHGVVDPQIARRRKETRRVYLGRVVFLILFLAIWQYFGSRPGGNFTVSTPINVMTSLWDSIADGSLFSDLRITATEVGLGFLLGATTGLVFGAIAGQNEYIARVLDPFIIGFYGTPKIAFAPLMVVWLGIGLAPKVALSALLVFFMVFFSTYQGIRSVDPSKINALRLMGANTTQLRRYVIFPGARGNIFLGLKLAVPQALIGAIVGEFISSSGGLGYAIRAATTRLDTAAVIAGLLVLMIVSLSLNAVVNALSRMKGQSDYEL